MANINIYGELHNDTPNGFVASSQEIMDTEMGMRQSEINEELMREVSDSNTAYLVCSTPGSTAAKTIDLNNFTLSTNVRLLIKMEHAHTNTQYTPTLNIGGTGMESIQFEGSAASYMNTWADGEVLDVYYDGTQYVAKRTKYKIGDVGYVECNTAAGTVGKEVNDFITLSGFELGKNVRVLVKMINTNTASNPTLNINGTGAKNIVYNGSAASSSNSWSAGEVLDVYYDGTSYVANTNGGAQFSTGEKVGNVGIGNAPGTSQETLMTQKGTTDLVSEYNVSTNNNSEYTFAQAVALVPVSLQKGGLTIKYIDSTTHEYTIKRLMSSTWNTTESNWQGIDNEPTAESNNLVKSGGVFSGLSQLDQEVNGLQSIDMYIGSTGKWGRSTTNTYLAYIVPVKQNDVLYAKWIGVADSNKGIRVLVVDYPSYGQYATNLLPSGSASTLEETITIQTDGYFVFWGIYANTNRSPQILTLNNKDVLIMIADVRTLIGNNKEQIEQNTAVVSTLSDIVLPLNDKIGDVEITKLPTIDSLNQGGAKKIYSATYGTYIALSSSTGYGTLIVDGLTAGNFIYYKTVCGTSSNYPYYLYFAHYNETAELWVLDKEYLPKGVESYNAEGIETVPEGSTRAYLTWLGAHYTNAYNQGLFALKKAEYYDLQSQINDKTEGLNPEIQQSQQDWMEWESDWFIKEAIMDQLYGGSGETTPYTAWKTAASAHSGITFRIACISDTHGSGAYSWRKIRQENRRASSCLRSIKVFNDIMNENGFCQCAMHGGDLSCDYGTSRKRDLDYMYDIVRKFHWYRNTPFFITKGNHDENNNTYVQVNDYTKLDWDNTTYYIRDFSNFNTVTKSEWDGSPLFVSKMELVSDKEFCNTIQNWMSPSGKVYGPGAYYYYDFDTQKIRMIIANSFPVKDDYTKGDDEEYAWFGQTALDLSSKDNPQDWQVIVIRHTECSSQTDLVNCLTAFKNGTTWTYGSGEAAITVDYGTLNGGGCTVIAHIHGHEHGNNIANNTGIMDIGVNWANVSLNDLGNATYYGLNIFSFDLENHIIYQDEISGLRIEYDYENNLIRLPIGTTIYLSRNGLGNIVPTSSDINIINVGGTGAGSYATGVALGTADVTVTVGQNSKIYHFQVIS